MEHDFSKGSMSRHIMMQAVPLMIAQILQLLYNVVDRIYIGHLPGEDGLALTGIGLVFPDYICDSSIYESVWGWVEHPFVRSREEPDKMKKRKKSWDIRLYCCLGLRFC